MKLFHKLLLLLSGLVVLPLALSSGVVAWRAERLKQDLVARSRSSGHAAADLSGDALYEQARRNQLEIVRSKAVIVEDFFETARQSVQLLAVRVEEALHEAPPAPGASPPQYTGEEVAEKLEKDPRFEKEEWRKKPYTIYHLAPGTKQEAAAMDLKRLSRLGSILAYYHTEYDWVHSAYLGHADGFIVGYPGGTRFSADYDPRNRYWYDKTEKKGMVNWTKIYIDRAGHELMMTVAMPIFRDGKIIAVSAVDVELEKIVDELFNLRKMPVKSALLIDDRRALRVSSDYRINKKVTAHDARLEPLLIDKYGDGLFAKVYDEAQRKGEDTGVVVLDVPEGRDLFAWATITLRSNYAEGMKWRYMIRMPVDPIVKSVWKVREDLGAMSAELAGSIDAEVRKLRLQLGLVALIVLLAALLVSARAAKTAAEPLVEMARAVDKIGRGDFATRVEVRSRDELGEVARAINDMAEGLEEGAFVKNTFKRYVSAAVVNEILKDPGRVKLGGERREMTVFFSDIAGFSTLAEKMEPEKLVELINEYLGVMTELIFAHRGTLDKYEGDAIMAFWNAPIHQEDHALRACRAALDNLAALRRLQEGWAERGLIGFEIRIGINTGPMIVGNMGSPARLEYTVLGDAVNVGARLEQENKKFGTRIMISESTLKAAGLENLNVRELGQITVKGRSAEVKVYELLGLRSKTKVST